MIEIIEITSGKVGMWSKILLLSVFVLVISASESWAAKFIRKDKRGTWLYSCENACGRVRVFRIEKNIYRVLSIYFSGEVSVKSPDKAAKIACREVDSTGMAIAQSSRNRACP